MQAMNTDPRPAAGSTNAGATRSTAPANNTGPLVIVTILFFMWGLLTSLNDVLIPHLKAIYTLSFSQAMLVQFCFFGAYLAQVPTYVITAEYPAFLGVSAILDAKLEV